MSLIWRSFLLGTLCLCGGCGTATNSDKASTPSVGTQAGEVVVLDAGGTWLVSVAGIVKRPGIYRVNEGTTLLRLLNAAGLRQWPDPLPHSAIKMIKCTLLHEGKWVDVTLDASFYIKNPARDFPLNDGSKITVPELLGI
jgi:hypothetical protein